jgi:hypothetical protein
MALAANIISEAHDLLLPLRELTLYACLLFRNPFYKVKVNVIVGRRDASAGCLNVYTSNSFAERTPKCTCDVFLLLSYYVFLEYFFRECHSVSSINNR